jgi:hypothetical protein
MILGTTLIMGGKKGSLGGSMHLVFSFLICCCGCESVLYYGMEGVQLRVSLTDFIFDSIKISFF